MILLPGREDRDIWAYFASLAFPPEHVVRTTLAALARAGRPVSAGALETRVDLRRGRLEMMLKVLDVDGAVQRVSGGWQATGQDWVYDAERYERVAAERSREQQAMLDYLATGGCRMEYLRRELDDPAAAPCGRCDNCTGRHWSAAVSEAGTAAARDRLMRPGVDVAPRKMWPTGMKDLGVEVAGKIPATEAAETGRALGRLTDLGWGPRLRALLEAGPADGTGPDRPGTGSGDQPAPDELVAALVKVLAAWDWAQRPAGVVTVPSRRHPQLIGSLGRQLAGLGRLPYLGALAYTWDAGAGAGPGAPPPGVRPGPALQQRPAAARCLAGACPPRGPGRRRGRGGRSGAARRRPDRQRLDDDRRGPAAPPGRRPGRAAVRAGRHRRLAIPGRSRPGPGAHAVDHRIDELKVSVAGCVLVF